MKPPEPERPFSAPWEAEAFAMVVKLHEAGIFTWSEWTRCLGEALQADPTRPYYESWLAALEQMVEAKDLMSDHERQLRMAAWDRASRATPHGQPILLENAEPSFDFRPV